MKEAAGPMSSPRTRASARIRPSVGSIVYLTVCATLVGYFAIEGVRGEFGLFRRIQIDADAQQLRVEKATLEAQVAVLRNRTQRMSDSFLDLDLLDERVRDVLGYVRADEVVVR